MITTKNLLRTRSFRESDCRTREITNEDEARQFAISRSRGSPDADVNAYYAGTRVCCQSRAADYRRACDTRRYEAQVGLSRIRIDTTRLASTARDDRSWCANPSLPRMRTRTRKAVCNTRPQCASERSVGDYRGIITLAHRSPRPTLATSV